MTQDTRSYNYLTDIYFFHSLVINKQERTLKGQSKMDNPEKLAT